MSVVKALTADEARAIRYHDSAPLAVLAEQYGVSMAAIRAARGGAEGVKAGAPFVPLCMSPEALAEWSGGRDWQANGSPGESLTPVIPCDDCMPLYALEMRAIGRCNGHPCGVESDEDELEVPAPRKKEIRTVMASVRAILTAPCDTCSHEPICNRTSAIRRLGDTVNVESTPLPSGLTVAVAAVIECDMYARAKRATVAVPQAAGDTESPKPTGGSWTPERRAAQAELMRGKNNLAAFNAAKRQGEQGEVEPATEPVD